MNYSHRFSRLLLSLALALPGITPAEELPACEDIPVSYDKASLYTPGQAPQSSAPIVLGAGPHLFIDDYLVDPSSTAVRGVHKPDRSIKIPNPVVTGIEDGCFQPYLSVHRDETSGRFRIWYGHRTEDNNGSRSRLGYLESADGIRWDRPARTLDVPGEIQFGVSVIDEGPNVADPGQRLKYGWYFGDGLRVAASPDGLNWSALAEGTVLRHNHDISGIYRDTIRNRYVAIASVYRESDFWEDKRRITMQATSDDLVHWEPAHHIILPDKTREEGEVQFYAMDGFLQRGDLTIGMVKVLRDDLKADDPPNPPDAYGTGYTALAWSRDGEHWVRDLDPYFERDMDPKAWDHSHAWIDEQVPVKDKVYLYYGGYAHGHKVNRFEERQIGLVTIKKDRYVSRGSDAKYGTLLTPLLSLEATNLRVNATVGGSLKIRVLDEAGAPIPGFDFTDMTPIQGDYLEAPVKWNRPMSELKGKPLRLEFELITGGIYAFYL